VTNQYGKQQQTVPMIVHVPKHGFLNMLLSLHGISSQFVTLPFHDDDDDDDDDDDEPKKKKQKKKKDKKNCTDTDSCTEDCDHSNIDD